MGVIWWGDMVGDMWCDMVGVREDSVCVTFSLVIWG